LRATIAFNLSCNLKELIPLFLPQTEDKKVKTFPLALDFLALLAIKGKLAHLLSIFALICDLLPSG